MSQNRDHGLYRAKESSKLTKTVLFYLGYCFRIRVFNDVFINHQIDKHFTHRFRITNICRDIPLLFNNQQKPSNYKLRICIQDIYLLYLGRIYIYNFFNKSQVNFNAYVKTRLERNVSQSHFCVNLLNYFSLQPTSYNIKNLTSK